MNNKSAFAPSRTADTSTLVFPRQQSIKTRELEWEDRMAPPLEPLWVTYANGIGLVIFMVTAFMLASIASHWHTAL